VRAFDLMRARIATAGAAPADITIAPAITGRAGLGDWTRADEMIASGRAAVEAIVPRLRARLALDASTMAMPERIAA
jgi:NTE family protein